MRIGFFILFLMIFLSSSASYHTVQKGETYASIAKLYDVPLDSLVKANHNREAFAGMAIKIPLPTVIFDMGCNNLFRILSRGIGSNADKGDKLFRKAHEKQGKLSSYKDSKRASAERDIIELYEKAVSYGNLPALYQLGRYLIHGELYMHDDLPSFTQPINRNVKEFKLGIEYAQIVAILSKHKQKGAAIELAVACGHRSSPMYNPYFCLSLLESFRNEFDYPVDYLLCYMYENGYGVNQDYIKAYIYATNSWIASTKEKKSHRELIMEKIEGMPADARGAKYGVGLDNQLLLAIAYSHFKDNVMDPEGMFYLHRAARLKNAEANWALASILNNNQFDKDYFASSDKLVRWFAQQASDLGNEEATAYIDAYNEYQRQKEERERQEELQREREKQERKERRRQNWMNALGTIAVTAAETYVAVESYKQAANSQGYIGGNVTSYAAPHVPLGQMSDAEFQARNQLALNQLLQYTINQAEAEWTGKPMRPTDMSAVDFGTDTSPGSALWMWNQYQEIDKMATYCTQKQIEMMTYMNQQKDAIERHLIEQPFAPISGYVSPSEGWVSAEEVMAGRELEQENAGLSGGENKHASYFKEHYGYKTCSLCRGTGVCKTCNGNGWYYPNQFGTGERLECPNCPLENGRRSGKCSWCNGTGQVYGSKH